MNDAAHPASAAPTGWTIERATGPASELHARPVPEPVTRTLWLLAVARPALVVGSAQRDGALDTERAARLGIEVVRRHSGGAAVLLEPDGVVWADIIIGRHDRSWDDDIGRATWWVGQWWSDALARLGLHTTVHRGPMVRTAWSERICFAGLGPGEVLLDGRKVVGISQRRTRQYARFQTAALLRWEPTLLAELIGGPAAPAGPDDQPLLDAAIGIDRPAAAVIDALVATAP